MKYAIVCLMLLASLPKTDDCWLFFLHQVQHGHQKFPSFERPSENLSENRMIHIL